MENSVTTLIHHCGNEVESRFWAKVDRRSGDECWPWLARAKTQWGYGVFGVNTSWREGAHRVAYMLDRGERIPKGLYVRHSCDNPACCNPKHLSLGTPLDNMRDMYDRGRDRHIGLNGEANGRAKLSNEDISCIRSSNLSHREVAERYSISRGHARRVRLGLAWKDAA